MKYRDRHPARIGLALILSTSWSGGSLAEQDQGEVLPTLQVEARAQSDFQDAMILPEEQSFVPADPASLLDYAPGATVNKNGPLTGIAQYRGMYGSRINTLIDGLNVAPAGPNWMDPPLSYIPSANLYDLRVVRGISPVSAGSETIGGTIRVSSRQGEFGESEQLSPHGVLGAGGQSVNNAYDGNGLLWLSNRNHRFQVSGTYRKGSDDVEAGNGKDIVPTEYKRWSAGGGYGFRTGELELGLNYSYDKTEDTGTPALPMDIDYIKGKTYRAQAQDRLGGLLVEARAHYMDTDHRMDNYSMRQAPLLANGRFMRRYALTDSTDASYDLRAEADLKRGVLRFGTDGWLPNYDADVFSPDNPSFKVNNYNDIKRDRFGFFGEWQGDVVAGWEVRAGARYTRVNSDAGRVSATSLGMNQGNGDILVAAFNGVDRDRSDNLFDLALVLRHGLSDDIAVELGVARKQRAPSYQERYLWMPLESTAGLADGRVYVGDVNLDPETAYNLDLGLDWRTSRFYFTPRVFYKRVNDYIQGTPLESGAAVDFRYTAVSMVKGMGYCRNNPSDPTCIPLRFSNVDAEFYGADAGFGLSLGDHWRVDGNVSYVRGKRRDGNDDLYRISPPKGLLGLTYQRSAWSVTAEGEYFAKQNHVSEANAEQKTDSYGLLNLYGRYWFKDSINLRAGVRNLLDNTYRNHLSGYNRVAADANGDPVDLKVGERLPGPGRDFFLQAEYSF